MSVHACLYIIITKKLCARMHKASKNPNLCRNVASCIWWFLVSLRSVMMEAARLHSIELHLATQRHATHFLVKCVELWISRLPLQLQYWHWKDCPPSGCRSIRCWLLSQSLWHLGHYNALYPKAAQLCTTGYLMITVHIVSLLASTC